MLLSTIGRRMAAEPRVYQKLHPYNTINTITTINTVAPPHATLTCRCSSHFYRPSHFQPSTLVEYFHKNCNETSNSISIPTHTRNFITFGSRYDTRFATIQSQYRRDYTTLKPNDRKNNDRPKMRVPKLILIQNPITWLVTKFDFGVLRSVWDPTFEEKAFKMGTKQAVSRVTQIVSEGRYADLSGLLTRAAKSSLLKDLERSWTDRQKQLIFFTNDDIQITSPRKVYFIRVADKKYCAVDMAFLALKWATASRADGLVFAEMFARFHRDYTASSIPEWTIAYFKVTRFDILRRK